MRGGSQHRCHGAPAAAVLLCHSQWLSTCLLNCAACMLAATARKDQQDPQVLQTGAVWHHMVMLQLCVCYICLLITHTLPYVDVDSMLGA
jgi:hypothetical protein